jgi:hypothetical protein
MSQNSLAQLSIDSVEVTYSAVKRAEVQHSISLGCAIARYNSQRVGTQVR